MSDDVVRIEFEGDGFALIPPQEGSHECPVCGAPAAVTWQHVETAPGVFMAYPTSRECSADRTHARIADGPDANGEVIA